MRAEDVFVFAGAGISFHSQLPGFNRLRNDALADLGLEHYTDASTIHGRVAAEMLPEPFMNALASSGFDVPGWLSSRFKHGKPTDGHHALDSLARRGAAVWTVNFDELIEATAATPLDTCAWPDSPGSATQLLKPHGTLSGEIIVTAEQVLGILPDAWHDRLRHDTAGRTALMIGYSGRDLDFRPIWADVLQRCSRVIWFDIANADFTARQHMLRTLDRSRLEWREHDDPTVDFVDWCHRHDLIEPTITTTFGPAPTGPQSRIPPNPFYKARFQQLLGDLGGARRTYLSQLHRRPVRSVELLAEQQMNHGSTPTARVLEAAASVVSTRDDDFAEALRRKALTIYANTGNHERVAERTENYEQAPTSVAGTLRAATLRATASLDESIDVAWESLERARREQHPVRAANAGYQYAQSLVWAHRHDEAEQFLNDPYDLIASNAANRWVAWRDLLLAAIAIHADPSRAIIVAETGTERFATEGLLDGVMSGRQTLTVAHRANDDLDGARSTLASLEELRTKRGTFYLRHSVLSHQWVQLEHAEIARATGDECARDSYRALSDSTYPIMSSLAHLGLAFCDLHDGTDPTPAANVAEHIATSIGARYQAHVASDLLARRARSDHPLLFA